MEAVARGVPLGLDGGAACVGGSRPVYNFCRGGFAAGSGGSMPLRWEAARAAPPHRGVETWRRDGGGGAF